MNCFLRVLFHVGLYFYGVRGLAMSRSWPVGVNYFKIRVFYVRCLHPIPSSTSFVAYDNMRESFWGFDYPRKFLFCIFLCVRGN